MDKLQTHEMNYKQRVYYCDRCDKYIDFLGNDPVVGDCHCCHRPIASLELKETMQVNIKRQVTYL